MDANPHQCGRCLRHGHTETTCGLRKAWRTLRPAWLDDWGREAAEVLAEPSPSLEA